jgi:hypothetical protein
MKSDRIRPLLEKFENACHEIMGVEYWSARDLSFYRSQQID